MAADKAVEDLIRQRIRAELEECVARGMCAMPGEPELWTLNLFRPDSVLDGTGIQQTAEIRELQKRIQKEEGARAWVWISTSFGHLLKEREREIREWRQKQAGCLSVVIGVASVIALLVGLLVWQ